MPKCETCQGFGVCQYTPCPTCGAEVDDAQAEELANVRFSRGDEVARIDGSHLRSGASAYTTAYVLNVWPFVLVSEESDMVWSCTVHPAEFRKVGEADPIKFARCYYRRGQGYDA